MKTIKRWVLGLVFIAFAKVVLESYLPSTYRWLELNFASVVLAAILIYAMVIFAEAASDISKQITQVQQDLELLREKLDRQ